MKSIFIFLGLMFFFSKATCQMNIDSLVNTLHNKDVRYRLILTQTIIDSNGNTHHGTFRRILTSIDVKAIEQKTTKHLILKKLVESLGDPDKDWYANLLLTSLTGIYPLGTKDNVFLINNRSIWVNKVSENRNSSYKDTDVKFWINYLLNLGPTENWKR